jgi:8-oxo-dGTP diphosphatase
MGHSTEQHVRVGTSIIVVREGKVLAGRRKGSHAEGLISFPGGHLDFGETWEKCAFRELEEECGDQLQVKLRPQANIASLGQSPPVGPLSWRLDWFTTNDIMPQYGKHYITIFMVADWVSGEAINTEPDKCEGWEWITFDELKALGDKAAQWIPINLIEAYRGRIGI